MNTQVVKEIAGRIDTALGTEIRYNQANVKAPADAETSPEHGPQGVTCERARFYPIQTVQ